MHRTSHVIGALLLAFGTVAGCGGSDKANNGGNGTNTLDGGNGGNTGNGGASGNGGTSANAGTSGNGGTSGTAGSAGQAGGTGNGDAGTPLDGGADAGPGGIAVGPCNLLGQGCTTSGQCCSNLCDGATNKCVTPGNAVCTAQGGGCGSSAECCTGMLCDGGSCQPGWCVSDGEACTSDDECCGNNCVGNSCEPLNLACSTAGNKCTMDVDCCSEHCVDDGTGTSTKRCDGQASYCRQDGDICLANYQCCSGDCQIASGDSVGTCNPPSNGATKDCKISGTLCQDPDSGGTISTDSCKDCCTSLCGPWAPGKPAVCLPASGCRVVGELCTRNADCCGGDPDSGLPGAGNIECLKDNPDDPVGVCRNPRGCLPQGEVCKYTGADQATCSGVNAQSNDCCTKLGFDGKKSDTCQLDTTGVPRCNGLGGECRAPGETCSSAADCCQGLPCIPDNSGVLRCIYQELPDGGIVYPPDAGPDGGPLPPVCVMQGGTCTFSGDCCQGLFCNTPPGSIQGTCDNPNEPPPPPPSDGGTSTPDGGSTPPPPPMCSLFGQTCGSTADCCESLACSPTLNVCTIGG